MKMLLLLLLCLPSFVVGEYLDDYCGTTVWVESGDDTYYTIRDSDNFAGRLCKVDFDILQSRRIQLTVSGSSLSTADCKVNVYGSSDVRSQTGNIDSAGSFSRSVTSDDTGQLYLHVKGPRCSSSSDDNGYGYDLTFRTSTLCVTTDFSCRSGGQCVWVSDRCDGYNDCDDGSDEDGCGFWGVGAYVGVAVGGFVLVMIVVALSAVYYRRRLVLVQYPALVGPAAGGQAAAVCREQYAATGQTTAVQVTSQTSLLGQTVVKK